MTSFEWVVLFGIVLVVYWLYEIEQSLKAILRKLHEFPPSDS